MASALPFLPYGRQVLDEADIAAVVAVLKSPFLTQGPPVDRFEAVGTSQPIELHRRTSPC